MRPVERDSAYLWDIAEAAKDIQNFLSGVSWLDYYGNRMLLAAVERKLEIIGEASRRISEGFRLAHPEIPWRSMIGLRNVLAHDYGDIKHERIYHISTVLIPELIQKLAILIPPPPPQDIE